MADWQGYHGFAPAITQGRRHWYYLKEQLKLCGWTVRTSGDGLAAYDAGADIITSAGTGANGMDNAGAWFVIYKDDATDWVGERREWLVQVGATHTQCTVLDTRASGFTGGTPSATERPTATDEYYVIGTGTPAAPTYATWCDGSSSKTHHYMADADSTAFYMLGSTTSGVPATGTSGFFGLEPIYAHVSDPDHYVYLWCAHGSSVIQSDAGTIKLAYGKIGRGTAAEQTRSLRCNGSTSSAGVQNANIDTNVNKVPFYPFAYGNITGEFANALMKGVSKYVMMSGFDYTSTSDLYRPSTLNVGGVTASHLNVAGLVFPWDETAYHNEYLARDGEYLGPTSTTVYEPVDPTPTVPVPARSVRAIAAKVPTVKKVPRVVPGKRNEPATVTDVTNAIEPMRQAINQYADSVLARAKLIQGVVMDDGAETVVAHGLGRKPLGVLPCNITGADPAQSGGRIDRIPDQNEDRRVVLMAIGHGASITADLLVF